jgi:hypothetical protein
MKRADSWIVEALSIAAAIALGPAFLFLGYWARLMFAAGAIVYLAVCVAVVPLIVAFGGRFRFVVWQLAALSLALSVVIDDLSIEAVPSAHLKEYTGVAVGFWAIATVLSSPLPIFLFVQRWRTRGQHCA